MLKDGVDAIIDGLVEVLKIPILVGGQLLQFAAAMGVEVPNTVKPWATLLVALFVVALPFIIDRCRSVASRLILAYGILCTLFVLVLIASSTLLNRELARFHVQGHFALKTVQDDPKSVAFPPIRYGNDSCDANESHTNQVCSNSIEFTNATATITSANCGSGITSVRVDPTNKRCIQAVSHLQGCGYEHLPFGLNNCRGRGWIEFSVNGAGSVPEEHVIHQGSVDASVTAQDPLSIDLGTNHLGANDKIEFEINVLSGSQVIAKLTDSTPSQGDFAANVLPNGKLQVSYGKLRAD